MRCTSQTRAGGTLVSLEGVINDRADLVASFEKLRGVVVFDLEKIQKITSYGIRAWTTALDAVRADHYAFIRCPLAMLEQFNMVANFGRSGELISFHAPYACDACDVELTQLIDLRKQYRQVASFRPPPMSCPRCGGPARFDDDPERLFRFAAARPPNVQPAMWPLIDGTELAEPFTVRKKVERGGTALWLSGALTSGAPLKRVFDGLEGLVVAEMAGVTAATPAMIRELLSRLAGADVARLIFVRVPQEIALPLASAFSESGARLTPELASVLVQTMCPKCGGQVDCELARNGASCVVCRRPLAVDLSATGLLRSREMLKPLPQQAAELLEENGAPALVAPPNPTPIAIPRGASTSSSMLAESIQIIGTNRALREALEVSARIAGSDAAVLIRGETGTGKEMFARTVHVNSPRRDKPFVAVNCAALPPGTIESELFGHEKGSFTGAMNRSVGRFERANGGTLFIDEAGDLPLPVQAKLLRVLQEHCFERVGGSETIQVDIRIIAATHRPLEEMMAEGSFREDLFYRLNVVPIIVPPLRARKEDIWPLTEHYLDLIQRRWRKTGIRLGPDARRALEAYSWPGNVRELVNVVERIVALTPSEEEAGLPELGPTKSIGAPPATSTTPAEEAPSLAKGPLKDAVDDYERRLIREALDSSGGNRTRAAQMLGISRQALGQKLTKYKM